MKGCLSLIIKTVIAILVFFGLKYLGIIDFIQDKINERQGVSQEQAVDKAKEIIDLSEIDDEYSIDKTLKILKNRIILAQHNATGQKMLVLEPKNGVSLTKEDMKSDNVQEKIDNVLNKYNNKILKADKVTVIKHGSFNGLGQNIPYVKVKAEVTNLPIKDMEGIVGVAELNNGKNIIVISVNEKNKYSQIITEAFFKKVKNAQ